MLAPMNEFRPKGNFISPCAPKKTLLLGTKGPRSGRLRRYGFSRGPLGGQLQGSELVVHDKIRVLLQVLAVAFDLHGPGDNAPRA